MRIMVLGATGSVGTHVLDQALVRGYEVVAPVRRPDALLDRPGLRIVPMNLATATAAELGALLHGVDAVICTLGLRRRSDEGLLAAVGRLLTAAMPDAGVSRLVVLSAAPVASMTSPVSPRRVQSAGDDLLARLSNPLLGLAFGASDLLALESLLWASSLQWTIVRPPRLVDGGSDVVRTARDANVRGGHRIGRAGLAGLLLALLDQPDTIGHALGAAD